MELEEERRLRKTLEHRLAEQKMSQNHNNADISAEQLADSSQLHTLKTPDSKLTPDGFVASRSRYLKNVEFSPIPENLGSVADDDLWMQLNKGCITDLDMLEMTPDFECLLSPEDTTAVVQLEEPIDVKPETVCSSDGQQLEDSKARCTKLEMELELLKEENSYLRQELSESKHGTDHLISQKEELLKELETERYKMEELRQDVRLLSQAFSQRQRQLTSLYTKSKAIVENCKASRVALP